MMSDVHQTFPSCRCLSCKDAWKVCFQPGGAGGPRQRATAPLSSVGKYIIRFFLTTFVLQRLREEGWGRESDGTERKSVIYHFIFTCDDHI